MRNITFLFLLIFISSFSQSNHYSTQTTLNQDMNRDLKNTGTWVYSKGFDKTIQGSEYLFKNWVSRFVIQSKSGSGFSIENLNYNLRTKKIESQINSDTIFQFDTDKIDYIINFNKKYKVINNELLEELSKSGKLTLYKEHTVRVQEGVLNPLTQKMTRPREYVKMENYYCLINDVLKPIKLKKKDILNIMSDKEVEIKKFCKENNLSFSKEEDVIKVFNYYNLQ